MSTTQMMRQSEFKRKYDPEMGKYTKQHIYGEGIMDSVKSFFKKPTPKPKPLPKQPKKVTFEPSSFADKKAGDKIVKILSRENPPTTKKTTSHRKMTEKEYNQYLENLRKLYNY